MVANLYYNQPLLATMARGFGTNASAIGAIPALTQGGYAAGLFLVVPLGDVVERRRLVLVLLALAGVSLAVTAIAPSLTALLPLSFAIGVFSVVPQVLIPFAASRALPEARGRTIGTIMGGLLTGILLARTVSGFVGAHAGWRTMYGGAAVLMALVAVVLSTSMPARTERESDAALLQPSYGALIRSLGQLWAEHSALREVSLIGAMCFAAFSAFWSTLAFFLTAPPWHFGSQAVGLFGVVGVAGVLAAPITGRLADRHPPRLTALVSIFILVAAFVVLALGRYSLPGLIAGVVLLDLGAQTALVSNQARIYALSTGAASRLNTVFMTSYFIGGALGSVAAAWAWQRAGWTGVCASALTMLAVGLIPYVRRNIMPETTRELPRR